MVIFEVSTHSTMEYDNVPWINSSMQYLDVVKPRLTHADCSMQVVASVTQNQQWQDIVIICEDHLCSKLLLEKKHMYSIVKFQCMCLQVPR